MAAQPSLAAATEEAIGCNKCRNLGSEQTSVKDGAAAPQPNISESSLHQIFSIDRQMMKLTFVLQ